MYVAVQDISDLDCIVDGSIEYPVYFEVAFVNSRMTVIIINVYPV